MSDGASTGSGNWWDSLLDAGVKLALWKEANQTQVDIERAKAEAMRLGQVTPTMTSVPVGAAAAPVVQHSVGGVNLSGLMTPLLMLAGAALVWKMVN